MANTDSSKSNPPTVQAPTWSFKSLDASKTPTPTDSRDTQSIFPPPTFAAKNSLHKLNRAYSDFLNRTSNILEDYLPEFPENPTYQDILHAKIGASLAYQQSYVYPQTLNSIDPETLLKLTREEDEKMKKVYSDDLPEGRGREHVMKKIQCLLDSFNESERKYQEEYKTPWEFTEKAKEVRSSINALLADFPAPIDRSEWRQEPLAEEDEVDEGMADRSAPAIIGDSSRPRSEGNTGVSSMSTVVLASLSAAALTAYAYHKMRR